MQTGILSKKIAEKIREDISTGKYVYGERIPVETKLAEEFNVSRTTIRRALEILSEEGFLVLNERHKYIVNIPSRNEGQEYEEHFTNYLKENNIRTYSKIVTMEVRTVSKEDAESTAFHEGDTVQDIHKVRYVKDLPVMNEYLSVNTSIVYGLNPWDLEENVFGDILRKVYSINITKMKSIIMADTASQWEISNLQLKKGDPILSITTENYNSGGDLVYICEFRFVSEEFGKIRTTWEANK